MTDPITERDEKRLRIAQIMHWPVDEASGLCHVPSIRGMLVDPFRSLDACHEMEEVLTDDQWKDYTVALGGRDTSWAGGKALLHATAPQRCEAFLQVINPPNHLPRLRSRLSRRECLLVCSSDAEPLCGTFPHIGAPSLGSGASGIEGPAKRSPR